MQELKADNASVFYLPQNLRISVYQCILEETLDQLCILKSLRKDVNIRKNKLVKPENIGSIERDLAKFEKKFNFIEHTLHTTYEELASNGTYEKLSEVVREYNKSKVEDMQTKEETARLQTELKELECILYEEEKFYHRRIAEVMADIGKIKDDIEVCY